MPLSADELAQVLQARPHTEHAALPGRRNNLRAGVSVPLLFEDGRIDALLTLRPKAMRRHGGEISFPGGRQEEGDDGLLGTARRETREELGLERLRLLGRLASMPVYTSDFRIEPFVVQVDPDEALRPDPGEVERVLRLDLGQALHTPLEGLEATHLGRSILLPLFRAEDLVVFGATALTLYELLGVIAETTGAVLPALEPSAITWQDLQAHKAYAGR